MKEKTLRMLEKCGFKKHVDRIRRGQCPTCELPITDKDRNEEFENSGHCLHCQAEAEREEVMRRVNQEKRGS